jgi:hypothetical protein
VPVVGQKGRRIGDSSACLNMFRPTSSPQESRHVSDNVGYLGRSHIVELLISDLGASMDVGCLVLNVQSLLGPDLSQGSTFAGHLALRSQRYAHRGDVPPRINQQKQLTVCDASTEPEIAGNRCESLRFRRSNFEFHRRRLVPCRYGSTGCIANDLEELRATLATR